MEKNTTIRFAEFHKAFLELKGAMSIRELSEKLGMANATVGYYATGERIPDALGVRKIAETFNVSADWLLGLSSVKERDADLQAICDYTHLSPEAVEVLRDNPGEVFSFLDGAYFADAILTHPNWEKFVHEAIGAGTAISTASLKQREPQEEEFVELLDKSSRLGYIPMKTEDAERFYSESAMDYLKEIVYSIVKDLGGSIRIAPEEADA